MNSNNSKRELKGEALNELKQTGEQSNNLDSLFPRMDISKKITPKMLKDFNEGKKLFGETPGNLVKSEGIHCLFFFTWDKQKI